jgi:hypothetical protein
VLGAVGGGGAGAVEIEARSKSSVASGVARALGAPGVTSDFIGNII